MFERVLNTPVGAFLKHFTKSTRLLNYCLAKACNFLKKETLTHVFCCEFCEISKNNFCYRTTPAAASDFTKVLGHLFTDLSRLLLYIVNMIIPNIKTLLNNVKWKCSFTVKLGKRVTVGAFVTVQFLIVTAQNMLEYKFSPNCFSV